MSQNKCSKCGTKIDSCRHYYIYSKDDKRVVEICGNCMSEINAESASSHVKIFEPFWHPNLDKKPVWIKSKKHLKEESDKRGMTSYY